MERLRPGPSVSSCRWVDREGVDVGDAAPTATREPTKLPFCTPRRTGARCPPCQRGRGDRACTAAGGVVAAAPWQPALPPLCTPTYGGAMPSVQAPAGTATACRGWLCRTCSTLAACVAAAVYPDVRGGSAVGASEGRRTEGTLPQAAPCQPQAGGPRCRRSVPRRMGGWYRLRPRRTAHRLCATAGSVVLAAGWRPSRAFPCTRALTAAAAKRRLQDRWELLGVRLRARGGADAGARRDADGAPASASEGARRQRPRCQEGSGLVPSEQPAGAVLASSAV